MFLSSSWASLFQPFLRGQRLFPAAQLGCVPEIYGQLARPIRLDRIDAVLGQALFAAVVVTGARNESRIENLLLFETDAKSDNTIIAAGNASIAIDPSGNDAIIEMQNIV